MVNSVTDVPLKILWQETKRGKSIARILSNWVLSQWRDEVKGTVLDLACGAQPSYCRVLGIEANVNCTHVVGVDYNLANLPQVVADLTQGLPFKDGITDAVILWNFLYIPSNPEEVLSDIRRVVKDGGRLLLTAPLVFPYTPEPTDHWRFTEEGIRYLLQRTRFLIESIVAIGGRWTSVAYLLTPFLRPHWLIRPLIYWLCLRLDQWTMRRFPHLTPCPIGYVVKARALRCR